MNFDPVSMLYSLPAVVLGLTFHEYMHAYAAFRLGDTTARDEGRLSLNPLHHIDPIGFVFLLVAGFGWARPVTFRRENLRHPRRDESIIALAGPVMNLFVALFFSVLLRLVVLVFPYVEGNGGYEVLINILLYMIYINYGLFVFNLIPIPPLDGSHLIFTSFTFRPETEAKIYRWGSIGLLVVIIVESATGLDLLPIGRLTRLMARAVFGLLGM